MSDIKIGVFVATMTGLAEICAEEIVDVLTAAGAQAEAILLDNQTADALVPFGVIVFVSSTYGHGDIPDNAHGFFDSLSSGIDLSGKRYAIFALGDRSYASTFCAAGDKWDAALSNNGATQFVDIEKHDASAGTLAEDVAAEWAAGWASRL